MTICDVYDCTHNNKHGICKVEPEIHNGRCVSSVVDMEHLREKWVYVKGRDQVRQNKPGYDPNNVEDEK